MFDRMYPLGMFVANTLYLPAGSFSFSFSSPSHFPTFGSITRVNVHDSSSFPSFIVYSEMLSVFPSMNSMIALFIPVFLVAGVRQIGGFS